jgi:hypothetical protein
MAAFRGRLPGPGPWPSASDTGAGSAHWHFGPGLKFPGRKGGGRQHYEYLASRPHQETSRTLFPASSEGFWQNLGVLGLLTLRLAK